MLNVIEPTNHHLHKKTIHTFLGLLKIYQDFGLLVKAQDKATFIIAEDERRGVYGGAVFFPQKIRDLDEPLNNLLSIQENRTVWCAHLCCCIGGEDEFLSIELYGNFYRELYKILSVLGKKKNTNCLPMKLSSQDYRNSLLYGNWTYLTELRSEEASDYVYVLLVLPEYQQQTLSQQKWQSESQSLDTPLSANTDRPVQ